MPPRSPPFGRAAAGVGHHGAVAPDPAVDDPHDMARLADCAAELAAAVEAALPGWVERVVAERWSAWRGESVPEGVATAARRAGEAARSEVGSEVRALLSADVDQQRTNPLALLRAAVVHPARVLEEAGVPAVVRDEGAQRLFPADVYDLTPGSFSDIDPTLHEPGLVWGAAKAHVILRRRRGAG